MEHVWEDIDENYDSGVVFIHFVCRNCKQHANVNQDTEHDTLSEATDECPGPQKRTGL